MFFKKKDPILEILARQEEQLKELSAFMDKREAEVNSDIAKAEGELRALGYTDEDLENIKCRAKFNVVK